MPLLGFSLVLVLSGACDRVSLTMQPPVEEENPNDVFYTTKDAVTFNPTALKGLEKASQVSIAQAPQYGEARFTDNGLIYYRYIGTASVNKDRLMLRGRTQEGSTIDKEVLINIVASGQDMPCYAGAIGDKAEVEASSTTILNVTDNDKTCGSISAMQIEVAPKHGTASIEGRRIIYTPAKDYIGEDIFFYRIDIANTKNPVAPVELTIVEPSACINGLKDDVLNLSAYVPGSKVAIDVLQNDVVCALYSKAALKIITQPQFGNVSIDTVNFDRPVIIYQAGNVFTGSDTFEYALYRDDTHFIRARVSVSVKP